MPLSFYSVFSYFWNMQLLRTPIFSFVMPIDKYLIRSLPTYILNFVRSIVFFPPLVLIFLVQVYTLNFLSVNLDNEWSSMYNTAESEVCLLA